MFPFFWPFDFTVVLLSSISTFLWSQFELVLQIFIRFRSCLDSVIPIVYYCSCFSIHSFFPGNTRVAFNNPTLPHTLYLEIHENSTNAAKKKIHFAFLGLNWCDIGTEITNLWQQISSSIMVSIYMKPGKTFLLIRDFNHTYPFGF